MRISLNSIMAIRYYLIIVLVLSNIGHSNAQELYNFIERCKGCSGKVKRVETKQKVDFKNYQSPVIYKVDDYNIDNQLVKTKISVDRLVTKTIQYFYKDSLLVYELHESPGEDKYFLVYQYFKKNLPTKIIKVDEKRRIIKYAELKYNEDFRPLYLAFYNLLGELLAKSAVEYYSDNQVVIRSSTPSGEYSNLQRFELLCKYNEPRKLRKRDFKDIVTKPINLEYKDNLVRVVKAVLTDNKEKVQIDEISYDSFGNWFSKKTYELKNNRNKKRLIREIEREIEYY